MASTYVFAFLPYLRTTEPVSYRGVTFRNSTDPEGIPREALADFTILKQLFFLRDNYRIQDTTYTSRAPTGTDQDDAFFNTLIEFQTVLAYLYSAPRAEFNDIFLSSEHASLYWFVPKDISQFLVHEDWGVEQLLGSDYPTPNDRKELPGYEMHLSGRLVSWITMPCGTTASCTTSRSSGSRQRLESNQTRREKRAIRAYYTALGCDPTRKVIKFNKLQALER